MYLTDEEKDEQSHEQTSADALCRWCDSILSSVAIKSVCHSCYKLLTGANLKDEEIFGGRSR